MDNTLTIGNQDVSTLINRLEQNKQQIISRIRSKLTPEKIAKIRKVKNDPNLWNQLDVSMRQQINQAYELTPDLFAEKKIPQYSTKGMIGAGAQPISGLDNTIVPSSIADKTSKLKLAGMVEGYGNLMDKGYVPEIKQSPGGTLLEFYKYPFMKLMNLLNVFPRTEAAIAKQAYRKAIESGEVPKISDFKLSEYDLAGQAKKNLNPLEALKTLNIGKEGWKQVATETFEPFIKANSKYSGAGLTQAYKEMVPGTKFTKEFEYPEEWEKGSKLQKTLANVLPNEKGNWWQRLISGFAGSPADIAGLASDFLFDPLTYLGGGLAKGSKTGASMADDLVKQGTKVLPKGAEIGLTKAGRTAYETFKKSSGFDDIIRGLADDLVKPSGVIKGLSATDDIAKQTAINFLENKAINQFLQEVPNISTVNKYLDFGGLKIFGGTAVPGYKIAEKFGKLKNTPIVSVAEKLFNENANVPDELVPFKNWLVSAGENEKNAFTNAFYKIIKDGDKTDFDKVQKYLWIQSDIERANNKLAQIGDKITEVSQMKTQANTLKLENKINSIVDELAKVTTEIENAPGFQGKLFGVGDASKLKSKATRYKNLISNYTQQLDTIKNTAGSSGKVNTLIKRWEKVSDIADKYLDEIASLGLNGKQLKMADDLKVFWGDVAQQFKNATGKELNTYDFYTPIRYIKEEDDLLKKASLIGPAEQPFEQSRVLTRSQAEKLGLKPKDLITSSIQRLAEQEKNVFRSRIINEVKQFGSQTPGEGLVSLSNKIPELDGWYLPKEYEKVFNNTYRMFFADPSLSKLAKIYDKGLGLWKRWALSTTGYDFRNFYTDNVSGLMEYGLKYYNPKYWDDGVAVLKGKKKKVMLNGKLRYADDLLKEMKQTGEITETTMTAVEAGYGKAKSVIQSLTPTELKFKYVSMPRENLGRVIAGLIERDAGANKIVAANNVKKVFFDYAHSLTPFERNVAKRIVPFYTWLKNNARRQVELLFTRTGSYAAVPKAMNFVENISDKPEGYDEFRPDYQKDLGAFLTPFRQPGLPDWLADLTGQEKTKRAGMPLSFNPNFSFQDWSRLDWRDMFSALSPALKAPIELAFNKEVYFDSDIPNYTKAPAILELMFGKLPEATLRNMGMKRNNKGELLLNGKLNYLMRQNPLYALAARSFPTTETENTPYQNLSSYLGIKFMPYNEEKAKEQYYSDYSERANKALSGEGLPSTDQIKSVLKEEYYGLLDEKYKEALDTKKLLDLLNMPKEATKEIDKALEPYKAEKAKVKDMNIYELEELLMENGISLTLEDIQEVIRQRQLEQ